MTFTILLPSVLGCDPEFPAPENPEPVAVQLRDSPRGTWLYSDDTFHRLGKRMEHVGGPVICKTSPCDAEVEGGTVLRAGSPTWPSLAFQLPESGAVRVTVDPGWGKAAALVSLLAGIGADVGVVVGIKQLAGPTNGQVAGGLFLSSGVVLDAIALWAFGKSLPSVLVTPAPATTE